MRASSLAITCPAVDIFLLMLLPKFDIMDPCLWRLGSDLVEEHCRDKSGLCDFVDFANFVSLFTSECDRLSGVMESLGATLTNEIMRLKL